MKLQLQNTLCILAGMLALSTSNVKAENKNIVDAAVSAGNFKILAKALQVTGLDKVLKDKGPFTVFAPTDEAFLRLPKGTIATLLKPENKDKLSSILTYHVVSGKVNGAKAVSLKKATTVNGQKIKIQFKNAALYLNKSRVIATDIEATNGVIHAIDNVLIPKNLKSVKKNVTSKKWVSRKILQDAIDVGVDLFNDSNKKACTAIYKIALISVLEIKPKCLEASDVAEVKKTLARVDSLNDYHRAAWALRNKMDMILNKLK